MHRIISQIHQWLAWIFLGALLVQLYLAGAPLFGVTSFQPHRMLGITLTTLALLFPMLAVAGRLGRKVIGLSLLLVFLTIVQGMLPMLRSTIPWIAALHAVNALALMVTSARIGRTGRTEALQVN